MEGPKKQLPELDSIDGAHWFVEHAKETAHKLFTNIGELRPMAIYLAHRDPITSKTLPAPNVVAMEIDPTFLDSPRDKDFLRFKLFAQARLAEAFGFTFMNEVWVYNRERTQRMECVMVNVQHRQLGDGSFSFYAPIERNGDEVRLLPWDRYPGAYGDTFTGILETKEQIAQREALLEKLRTMPGGRLAKLELLQTLDRNWEAEGRLERVGLPWLIARVEEMDT